MTNGNAQIVEAYETLQLSPGEIAEQFDYEESAVIAVLAQYSSVYRKAVGSQKEIGFNDEQEQAVCDVISNIARGYTDADIPTQLRAAMFLRNDRRGRLDTMKQMNSLNINMVNFNVDLKKALAAIQKSKEKIAQVTEVATA